MDEGILTTFTDQLRDLGAIPEGIPNFFNNFHLIVKDKIDELIIKDVDVFHVRKG